MIEPKYPGVIERYVNLGECYDTAALSPLRPEIMGCMAGYKDCYQRAYRCLGAAAQIISDMRATLSSPELEQRMQKRAAGILGREVRRRAQSPGSVTQRFLSAITPKGEVTLFETAQAQCGRIYELSDSYGLAHTMLAHLLAGITAAGYDVVACPCPTTPERLEHLLVPQLSLAFVSSSPAVPFPGQPYRRIRLDAMVGTELLRRSRPRLRFSRKVAASLVEEAVSSLAQAKAMHDALEAIYNPHVDFDRVSRTAQAITTEILQ